MSKDLTSVELARRVRLSVLDMSFQAQSSHIGSALSVVDILAVMYSNIIDVGKIRRGEPDRDFLILSKGHATAALYATLAHSGVLDLTELQSYGQDGTRLMQHASHKVPGVEFSTGSLGHGLSLGCGVAEAKRIKREAGTAYVIVSDGDLNAGSTWEGIMYAATRGLNVVLIVDANGLQSLGPADEVFNVEPLEEKFQVFGWQTRVVDGHSHGALLESMQGRRRDESPLVVIARTTKGKGVTFMEGQVRWHYAALDKALLQSARDSVEAP